MTTHHLNLFFFPLHCFSDRKHYSPARWLRQARPSKLPLRHLYSAPDSDRLAFRLEGRRGGCVSGEDRSNNKSSPLSLLFSLDKESSFCLSDFLCLWPSIEHTEHSSLLPHTLSSPPCVCSSSRFMMGFGNWGGYLSHKAAFLSFLRYFWGWRCGSPCLGPAAASWRLRPADDIAPALTGFAGGRASGRCCALTRSSRWSPPEDTQTQTHSIHHCHCAAGSRLITHSVG